MNNNSLNRCFFLNIKYMQITPHLDNIVKLISLNPVVSIESPTGSGKSIAIPSAIANTGAKCFVSVPTRTAAMSLAEYQISTNSNMSKLVGYAAEGNIQYDQNTMIAYVTSGHMRRKMLSYFINGAINPIDFCDVLICDEFHTGSLDNTIIISLWMKAYNFGAKVPRLVIASATPIPTKIEPIPAEYVIDLKAFPIEYRYLSQDIDKDSIDPNNNLYTQAADLAFSIHDKFNFCWNR